MSVCVFRNSLVESWLIVNCHLRKASVWHMKHVSKPLKSFFHFLKNIGSMKVFIRPCWYNQIVEIHSYIYGWWGHSGEATTGLLNGHGFTLRCFLKYFYLCPYISASFWSMHWLLHRLVKFLKTNDYWMFIPKCGISDPDPKIREWGLKKM